MQDGFDQDETGVQVIAINAIDAPMHQSLLLEKGSFPMFQDVPSVAAWDQHAGGKDDIFVFRKDLTLHTFFSIAEGKTDLGTEEGYALVRDTALAALAE